jgi:hypothetical protein
LVLDIGYSETVWDWKNRVIGPENPQTFAPFHLQN